VKRSSWFLPPKVLIVHLLHEVSKGPASFWRPYLVLLPREYHTLALFPEAVVAQLQVPEAMQAARRARSEARRDWAAAHGVLTSLGLPRKFCRFGAWLWAAATVSRLKFGKFTLVAWVVLKWCFFVNGCGDGSWPWIGSADVSAA
jgi:hypothetical protein